MSRTGCINVNSAQQGFGGGRPYIVEIRSLYEASTIEITLSSLSSGSYASKSPGWQFNALQIPFSLSGERRGISSTLRSLYTEFSVIPRSSAKSLFLTRFRAITSLSFQRITLFPSTIRLLKLTIQLLTIDPDNLF
jgi:hypothetical protein